MCCRCNCKRGRLGVEAIDMTGSRFNRMTWRFMAASDPTVDRYLLRYATLPAMHGRAFAHTRTRTRTP